MNILLLILFLLIFIGGVVFVWFGKGEGRITRTVSIRI